MSENLRVYSVSVMAFSQLHPSAPKAGTYVEHLPALIPAPSIHDAAQVAKQFAFEKWPVPSDLGWYGHQAAILPVTTEFFELADRARLAGVTGPGSPVEAPDVFQFDV